MFVLLSCFKIEPVSLQVGRALQGVYVLMELGASLLPPSCLKPTTRTEVIFCGASTPARVPLISLRVHSGNLKWGLSGDL